MSVTYRDPFNAVCCVECGRTEELCECQDVEGDIHRRLTSPEGIFQRAVLIDIDSGKYNDLPNLFNELIFKVGTVGHKLANFQSEDPTVTKDIQRLIVEIAALTTILCIEGDQNYPYDPTRTFNEEE